jgi:hypothetical protein
VQSDQYNTVVYHALRDSDERYSGALYAGYVHNALAMFLLGMTGRGAWGSRRSWRAFKSRFRSKKNRCVACGCDLRGLTHGRCPECGVLIPDRFAEVYEKREDVPGGDRWG